MENFNVPKVIWSLPFPTDLNIHSRCSDICGPSQRLKVFASRAEWYSGCSLRIGDKGGWMGESIWRSASHSLGPPSWSFTYQVLWHGTMGCYCWLSRRNAELWITLGASGVRLQCWLRSFKRFTTSYSLIIYLWQYRKFYLWWGHWVDDCLNALNFASVLFSR